MKYRSNGLCFTASAPAFGGKKRQTEAWLMSLLPA